MTTTAGSRYLVTQEVSDELRVPINTLAWWRHMGRGPKWFRVGRRVLYRRDDLDAWLAEQYEIGTSESR